MVKHSEVKIYKNVKPSGKKMYIPYIFQGGHAKPLRLSWNTHTRAEIYANRVFERCVRMAIHKFNQTKTNQIKE